jgi:protein TonB
VTSLVLHGAALWLVVTTVDVRRPVEPPRTTLTPIEIVAPEPPPPPPKAASRAPAGAASGTRGRYGHDGAPRSQVPPQRLDLHRDLAVSYDVPSGPDPGNVAGTTGSTWGAGLSGNGIGAGRGLGGSGDGVGALPIPPAPPPLPSLARPPRVTSATYEWNITNDRSYLGSYILLELTIDRDGKVRDVRVVKGVERLITERAIDLARTFTFEPALDSFGHPTTGLHRWVFGLKGPHPPSPFQWRGR